MVIVLSLLILLAAPRRDVIVHQLHNSHRVYVFRLLQVADVFERRVEPLFASLDGPGQLRHDLEVKYRKIEIQGQSARIVSRNALPLLTLLPLLPLLSPFLLCLQLLDAFAVGALALLLQLLQPTFPKRYSSGSLEISQRYL
jgi:hypothetical protein